MWTMDASSYDLVRFLCFKWTKMVEFFSFEGSGTLAKIN